MKQSSSSFVYASILVLSSSSASLPCFVHFAHEYTEVDSFQRAVDFYIRMMMGHGFRTTGEKVGWKINTRTDYSARVFLFLGSRRCRPAGSCTAVRSQPMGAFNTYCICTLFGAEQNNSTGGLV